MFVQVFASAVRLSRREELDGRIAIRRSPGRAAVVWLPFELQLNSRRGNFTKFCRALEADPKAREIFQIALLIDHVFRPVE